MTTTRRELLVGALGLGAIGTGSATASAPPPLAPSPTDVGDGLRVTPGVARTGKIVVVDVHAATGTPALAGLSGTLGGRGGTAYPVDVDQRAWRLLVPVEIEETARTLPLALEARRADGTTTATAKTTTRTVRVQPGRYDRRSITVGKQFTSPSPEDALRAEAEAVALAAALRQSSPTRLWRGRFARPTAGPAPAPFGTLRTYNGKRRARHLGLDLDGAVGDAVVAANAGRVLLAAERFYSGGTVLLDHGEGLFTLYFHLSRIDVAAGQLVGRGAGLGAVGASGQVTGPHLHFTVKLGGCSVDPAQLLALDLAHDLQGPAAPTAPTSGPAPTSTPTPATTQ